MGKINIYNSLVSSAIFLEPEILNVLILQKSKNIVSYGMTGSNSSCFGIFNNLSDIENSLKHFKKNILHGLAKKKIIILIELFFLKFLKINNKQCISVNVGCSQVVRHRVLISCTVGSNPTAQPNL